MDLGALISRLEREDDAGAVLAAIGDLSLYARVCAAGEPYSETPAGYAAGAMSRFANAAGDDDWLAAITALQGAADPGRTLLTHALAWAITRDEATDVAPDNVVEGGRCGCGSGHVHSG